MQQQSQIFPHSTKHKKVYLDYSQVSPTYENHEFFKTPQLYSARNQKPLKGLLTNINGGNSINNNNNNNYNNNKRYQSEKRQSVNEQEVFDVESSQLRKALYAVNNEQGMLVDNANIDLYKRRKKSIPTIESTSQYQIDQALKYYSSNQQQPSQQYNAFKSPFSRQNRIIGNLYNQAIPSQVHSTSNADLINSSAQSQNYNQHNRSMQQSTIDTNLNESVEVNLTKRQQARRVIGGSSTRNASPSKLYGYDSYRLSNQYNPYNQNESINFSRERKHKSISGYSTLELGGKQNGEISSASLSGLDQLSYSQNQLNHISHSKMKVFTSKHTASASQSPNNKSSDKLFQAHGLMKKQSLHSQQMLHQNPQQQRLNLQLEPLESPGRNKKGEVNVNMQFRRQSSSVSGSFSPITNRKNKHSEYQNTSIDRQNSQVNTTLIHANAQVSQKALNQNGSIAKLQMNKQHALSVPRVKVIIVELIQDFRDIDKNCVRIDFEKYWLSLLNKSVKPVADIELMQRVQPYLIEIINSDYYRKFRTNNLQNKYLLTEVSKWNFLKEIQSYEKGEILQNKFYEFMIHYFLPSRDYREQLMKDVLLAINTKIQKIFPFQDDIDTLLDENANVITDLYQFNITSQILLAGNAHQISTLFPLFQKHLHNYSKNTEKIHFISERKKNFQQAFVVEESSPPPHTLNGLESPSQYHKQTLKLPQILKIPPNLISQASISSFSTPQKKYNQDKFELSLNNNNNNNKTTQKKLEVRNQSISEFPEHQNIPAYETKIRHTSTMEELETSSTKNLENKKFILKKEQKNSLYLTRNDIEALLKKYEKLTEKDILNFHAEFKYLVQMNAIYEEKANIGINSRLKKPFRQYLLYTQIFFSMNPSFSDKERQFQTQILEALQININVGEHQHSTVGWHDFLVIKICIANRLSHSQKIQFLSRFFNRYNLVQIPKQEFLDLIAYARGTTFNQSSEKIILNGFQEEIWKEIQQLGYIENEHIQIQTFFQNSNPTWRVFDDLIQWMFLASYE